MITGGLFWQKADGKINLYRWLSEKKIQVQQIAILEHGGKHRLYSDRNAWKGERHESRNNQVAAATWLLTKDEREVAAKALLAALQ